MEVKSNLSNDKLVKDYMHCPGCGIQIKVHIYKGIGYTTEKNSIDTYYCPVCKHDLGIKRSMNLDPKMCSGIFIPPVECAMPTTEDNNSGS